MKTKSLIRRSVVSVLIAQLASAVLLCAVALLHEHHIRFRAFDTRLQGRSDSLLGAVQDAEDPEDNVTIDPTELKLPSQDVYAVYNQGGRLLGTSANPAETLIARSTDGYRDVKVGDRRYRVLQREALRIIDRAENGGVGLRRPVTIVYASPEGHVWHEIFEAARFYLLAILLASGGVALLVATLLRRVLSPIAELTAATADLTVPSLSFVPPVSALELRELRPLTEILNQSISRLRASFARERQFFGDAAHELKTVIAVVRSSVQLLLLKPRSEAEYNAGLEGIVADTERLENLVTQMLQLGRVTEPDASTQVTDLADTVNSVACALEPIARQRGVTVHTDAHTNAMINITRPAAEALLSNLLLNAIQYSSSSSAIDVSVRTAGDGLIRLEVKDFGCGIGAEALPHIFDRFYREDCSRSRETGGAGLGLAISKSIVDAAGGTIEAQSTKGVGTTMKVTFTAA